MDSITVLAAGHVNWDVTLRVDRLPESDGEAAIRSQRQSGGGSAANVAAALAGLGVDVGLIGSVGDDDNGLLARRELEAAGVSLAGVRVVEDAETAVKYLLVDDDGEVAILGNDGVNEAVGPSALEPSRIRAADHIHLTGQRPETAAAIARIADEAGIGISFDPGRRLADREYGEPLALADVVFVTDREAAALFDDDPDGAADDRIVVVTCGADGAEAYAPSGTVVHAGFDIDPVDTAGAGDAFAAGFLTRWLADRDLERALATGNACGAVTASREGARSAPTDAELEGLLERRP
ncbi:PfkB domain protein [Natrinema pellirubrum DSM 15624]|uniref:PfkB domain protein n=1 Tax=Natrinema pellirubrum (strain DSM 15624 / CIP 106293 / JCM 10476 / NCIMB 786 / 157) TaxID=797303 RepID=L0JR18_NATP1|nr:PfkB family carbohydrate kinase [Natrinema pellirubrum]AGB33263.1 sugar kinase, ribokinase [Natrinema pellirubrum DSM 15624]ELY71628.1 PfkB domain protein [Natrinema pellirubrum DSM 15624]